MTIVLLIKKWFDKLLDKLIKIVFYVTIKFNFKIILIFMIYYILEYYISHI
jgi:hypothetical protein